jgi:hypothetical protein
VSTLFATGSHCWVPSFFNLLILIFTRENIGYCLKDVAEKEESS